jgi:hypothetical protein
MHHHGKEEERLRGVRQRCGEGSATEQGVSRRRDGAAVARELDAGQLGGTCTYRGGSAARVHDPSVATRDPE